MNITHYKLTLINHIIYISIPPRIAYIYLGVTAPAIPIPPPATRYFSRALYIVHSHTTTQHTTASQSINQPKFLTEPHGQGKERTWQRRVEIPTPTHTATVTVGSKPCAPQSDTGAWGAESPSTLTQ